MDFKDDIRRAAARSRQERINKGAVIGAAVAPDIKERAVLRTVAAAEIRHVHRRKRRSGRLRLGEWSGLRDIQAVIVHLDEIGVGLVERELQLLHGNSCTLELQVGERRVVGKDRVADLDGIALVYVVLCDLLRFGHIDRLHFIGLYEPLRLRLIVGVVRAELHDRIDLHLAAAAAHEKQYAIYTAADERNDQHRGDRPAQPFRQVTEKRYLPLFHPLRLLSSCRAGACPRRRGSARRRECGESFLRSRQCPAHG